MRTLLSLFLTLSATVTASARPAPADVCARVQSFAERAMSAGVSAALGVAIVMDGKIACERAYGWADATERTPATTKSLWYLASTSKSFTGMGVALLANEGRIDIHAPITTLLPNAKWHAGAKPETLTLADFLTHTMGLSAGAVVENAAFTGNIPEARWPELLQYSEPLKTRDMAYNNLGYNVAAMVIDRKRPEGWRKYLEREVFAPVGMRETFHRVSGLDRHRFAKPHEINKDLSFTTRPFVKNDVTMNAAGGHLATLRDLARWTIVNMQDGKIDAGRCCLQPQSAWRTSSSPSTRSKSGERSGRSSAPDGRSAGTSAFTRGNRW
jgi:CubicO group peptidase (beta-lactamase class C family)